MTGWSKVSTSTSRVSVGSGIGVSADSGGVGRIEGAPSRSALLNGFAMCPLADGSVPGISRVFSPSVLRYGVVLLDPRELGEDAVVAVYDGVMLDRQRADVGVGYRIGPVANGLE